VVITLTVVATLSLSGCTGDHIKTGWLPSTKSTTNQTGRVISLWNGSWIAALAVGVLVWGLIIWVMLAYRRRRDETTLPAQVRYHLPLEIMYTIIPLMMVGVLFGYTYRDQTSLISTKIKPDVTIGVVAKQWSWDFNYVGDNVYDTGVQTQLNGTPSPERTEPTLWLPVNQRVQFDLTSRDVIHSFWVPAFLMKMDVIPGIQNQFQVVPQRIGTFRGKCAELCGEYHSEMLFNVKVVSAADYQAHLADLRTQGQTGYLPSTLGRSQPAPTSGSSEAGDSNENSGNAGNDGTGNTTPSNSGTGTGATNP
jgi:cytochrome c oxidase subunit 2